MVVSFWHTVVLSKVQIITSLTSIADGSRPSWKNHVVQRENHGQEPISSSSCGIGISSVSHDLPYFFVRFCLRLLLTILRFALPVWDFLLLPARCRLDISDNAGIPNVAARLMGVPVPAANSALYVAIHSSSSSWVLI